VEQARAQGLANFSMLVSHVRVPPAIRAILEAPDNRVQAFLGPGHVCTVMGTREYEELAAAYGVPIVVTGFEPVDLLQGVWMAVRQLEEGRAQVENQYARVLGPQGNPAARDLVFRVFEIADRAWRGVGPIPESGHRLRDAYRAHDAEARFDVGGTRSREPEVCISGEILRGIRKPTDCPAFGTRCTPRHPLGATMVSAEGACAAYFQYGRAGRVQEARDGV
jgi:hydrogenase expression/formation protein HypD